jgi:hypothetical protein
MVCGHLSCEQGKSRLLHLKWRKLKPLNVNVQRHPRVCHRAEVYSDAFRSADI